MDQQNVEFFLALHGNKFPEERQYEIREMLAAADEMRFRMAQAVSYQDPTTMLIISVVAGSLGVDRFMIGQTLLGVLKLITCGGCAIWHIVDIFLIGRAAKEVNFEKLRMALL